jgi:uncharacterized protein YjbJ (UPF0337 family)
MSFMDKAKNKAEEMKGQAKQKSGDARGDESLKAEGQNDQASGKLKNKGEDVKDVFGK